MLRALGVLEQQPYFALEVVRGKGFLFFFNETFVLSEIRAIKDSVQYYSTRQTEKMIDIFLATRMARRDNAGGDCVLLMKHWTVTALLENCMYANSY